MTDKSNIIVLPALPIDPAFVAHCEAYFAELDAADEADAQCDPTSPGRTRAA